MLTPCGCVCGTRDSCACAAALNEERTTRIVFIESPDRIVCVDELRWRAGCNMGTSRARRWQAWLNARSARQMPGSSIDGGCPAFERLHEIGECCLEHRTHHHGKRTAGKLIGHGESDLAAA